MSSVTPKVWNRAFQVESFCVATGTSAVVEHCRLSLSSPGIARLYASPMHSNESGTSVWCIPQSNVDRMTRGLSVNDVVRSETRQAD